MAVKEPLPSLAAARDVLLSRGREWAHTGLAVAVVAILLGLGIANIGSRARWRAIEDGVLWVSRGSEAVAAEVAADSPAMEAGIRSGDVLLSIDGLPVASAEGAAAALHRSHRGRAIVYT